MGLRHLMKGIKGIATKNVNIIGMISDSQGMTTLSRLRNPRRNCPPLSVNSPPLCAHRAVKTQRGVQWQFPSFSRFARNIRMQN